MSFTVIVEPRQLEKTHTETGISSTRTVYEIKAVDGNAEGDEELLVGSNQGYENRKFAVSLAVRLFASPRVYAEHFGISPAPADQNFGEPVTLRVLDHTGALDYETALR